MIQYIEIRGTDRELLGTIKNFNSLIWQTEYNGTGAFEVIVPYTAERFEWLQPNNYITRVDSTEIGFIEAVTMDYSTTEGRYIKATGRFGLVLLARRLYHKITNYKCAQMQIPAQRAELTAQKIVKATLLEVTNTRLIDWLSIGEDAGTTETITARESTYQNALEMSLGVLNQCLLNDAISELGQRIKFNRNDLTASYEVFKGHNTDLVFSQEYKNLISFSFSNDETLLKTYFLIGGEGQGADRFYTRTNRFSSITPETRREFFIDSSVTKTYNDENGNEHTMSDADYNSALIEECKSHFPENSSVIKMSGTVDLSAYVLGTDYNVGDVVKIRDAETAIETSARIWAVTEIQDESGYRVEADFEGAN